MKFLLFMNESGLTFDTIVKAKIPYNKVSIIKIIVMLFASRICFTVSSIILSLIQNFSSSKHFWHRALFLYDPFFNTRIFVSDISILHLLQFIFIPPYIVRNLMDFIFFENFLKINILFMASRKNFFDISFIVECS